MATIDIYNLSGAKAGTMELAEEVFGAVNEDLLWEAITHYRASARAGTHATKNRWRGPTPVLLRLGSTDHLCWQQPVRDTAAETLELE